MAPILYKRQLIYVAVSRVTNQKGAIQIPVVDLSSFATITIDNKRLLDATTAENDSHSHALYSLSNRRAWQFVRRISQLTRFSCGLIVDNHIWMDTAAPVNLNNFCLTHQLPYERRVEGVAIKKALISFHIPTNKFSRKNFWKFPTNKDLFFN